MGLCTSLVVYEEKPKKIRDRHLHRAREISEPSQKPEKKLVTGQSMDVFHDKNKAEQDDEPVPESSSSSEEGGGGRSGSKMSKMTATTESIEFDARGRGSSGYSQPEKESSPPPRSTIVREGAMGAGSQNWGDPASRKIQGKYDDDDEEEKYKYKYPDKYSGSKFMGGKSSTKTVSKEERAEESLVKLQGGRTSTKTITTTTTTTILKQGAVVRGGSAANQGKKVNFKEIEYKGNAQSESEESDDDGDSDDNNVDDYEDSVDSVDDLSSDTGGHKGGVTTSSGEEYMDFDIEEDAEQRKDDTAERHQREKSKSKKRY